MGTGTLSLFLEETWMDKMRKDIRDSILFKSVEEEVYQTVLSEKSNVLFHGVYQPIFRITLIRFKQLEYRVIKKMMKPRY